MLVNVLLAEIHELEDRTKNRTSCDPPVDLKAAHFEAPLFELKTALNVCIAYSCNA